MGLVSVVTESDITSSSLAKLIVLTPPNLQECPALFSASRIPKANLMESPEKLSIYTPLKSRQVTREAKRLDIEC
jgi:hypothetical protein